MVVTKNAIKLRDENNELVPQEIESKIFGGTVRILPFTQGQYNSKEGNKVSDEEFIEKHLVEPKLDLEEIKNLPLKSKRELSKLVMVASGMTEEEFELGFKKGIIMMKERLEKN